MKKLYHNAFMTNANTFDKKSKHKQFLHILEFLMIACLQVKLYQNKFLLVKNVKTLTFKNNRFLGKTFRFLLVSTYFY